MNFLRSLVRTGLTAYVWDTAVGSDIDVTAIDPKLAKRTGAGRGAVGLYDGYGGDLVLTVLNPGGTLPTKNIFLKGIPAGTYLNIAFTKILASGSVVDEAPSGATTTKDSTAHGLVIHWEL